MVEYTWQVWKDNRFVGYVLAFGQWEALAKAKEKYGENLYVERSWLEKNILA
jgi:hypothetical protein